MRAYISSERLTFDDFVKNVKAPVVHHFNENQYCHRSWYWARDLDDMDQEVEDKERNSQP